MCFLGVSSVQSHFNSSQPQKVIFCRIFSFCSFLEFVPRITPLQIEVGSLNLSCMLSKSPRCAFWGIQLFGVKIQLCPNLGEEMLRGQKLQKCLYLNQLIENLKLYNISKNQLLELIKRGDIGFPPYLIRVLDVLFGGHDFSPHFIP